MPLEDVKPSLTREWLGKADEDLLAQQFSDLLGLAKVLTQYAAQTRYPGTSKPATLVESETALRLAREAVAFIVARLP